MTTPTGMEDILAIAGRLLGAEPSPVAPRGIVRVVNTGERHLNMLDRMYAAAIAAITVVGLWWLAGSSPVSAQADAVLPLDQIDAAVNKILEVGPWDEEVGIWRTKTQFVIDPVSHLLARRIVTIWDPRPSQNLDFIWSPAAGKQYDEEVISGPGHLTWRNRDRPAYDPRSTVGTYAGEMRNGRPDGRGEYKEVTGLEYSGEWQNGDFHGVGHLKLPNGDEYEGRFSAGKPHGEGRYINSAGEIYSGRFVNGRREGRAITTLANGVTYQSEWQNGMELAASRYVRLAQASGGAPLPSTLDGVDLGVVVNPVDLSHFKNADDLPRPELVLGYAGANRPAGFDIRPAKTRLMGMWKDDANIGLSREEELPDFITPEVSYGVFSYAKSLLLPLDLTLNVQNRTTSPIQITGAYVDVEKSVTDREPAIQISVGHDLSCVRLRNAGVYHPTLSIENFGWGHADKARISYAFEKPRSRAAGPARAMRSLGTIDKTTMVSFERDFADAGVNTALLARQGKRLGAGGSRAPTGFKCSTVNDLKACLGEIGGTRVFGSLIDKIDFRRDDAQLDPAAERSVTNLQLSTEIVGTLEYDWTDSTGEVRKRVSPFKEEIRLGVVNVQEGECDGSSLERIPGQNARDLRVDHTGYRVTLPFRESVPAGRVARFGLKLRAPRASQHDFTIAVQLADGRLIRSRPIHLLYYVPAWYPPPSRE